jgi:metal-responsive CopG/Arc/MetJ family transcriptional regulator
MTTANSTPITRTSAGIRSALLDELDSIRAGTSNPSRANAVARLTGGVVETLRVELDIKRHLAGIGKADETSVGSVDL